MTMRKFEADEARTILTDAFKVQDKMREEKGLLWTRKVAYLTCMKASLVKINQTDKELAEHLISVIASDVLHDLMEAQPDRDHNEITKELIADSNALAECVIEGYKKNERAGEEAAAILARASKV